MTNIESYAISSTSLNTLSAAATLTAFGAALAVAQPTWPVENYSSYEVPTGVSSYSHLANEILMGARTLHADEFDAKIAEMFVSFAAEQERLGPDIEAILYENLANLYE